MPLRPLHKFQVGERRYVIDTQTCFCFECDEISWDVLDYYPEESVSRIVCLLQDRHPRRELDEVVGELEWLRVTRAILAPPKDDALLEATATPGDLESMAVAASPEPAKFGTVIAAAGQTLLAGSRTAKTLSLTVILPETHCPPCEAATALDSLRRAATAAGKTLAISLEVSLPPLSDHGLTEHTVLVRVTLEQTACIDAAITALMALCKGKTANIADGLTGNALVARAVAVLRPVSARFQGAAQKLYALGFRTIILDIPAAWTAAPTMPPEAVVEALCENAHWYAGQLVKGQYFRLEPFATLFSAIHEGRPLRRADPAGVGELAVDCDGRLFPSRHFMDINATQVGHICEGHRDQDQFGCFAELGALHIPACLRCWANGLCGGGHAIIHQLRAGRPNVPEPVWCDSQRYWITHAIAIFNQLSAAEVNFSHIEAAMNPRREKVSWFAAAKALFQMRLRARPLAEKDAPWLQRWENWNAAAYFVCNESGLLLATRYDREMDAIHPRGIDQELVLTRPDGQPSGLFKIRPADPYGVSRMGLYLRDEKDYARAGVRRTLRTLLEEMTRAPQTRLLLVPVTEPETALAGCLEAIGFHCGGIQREALYLHGEYQHVLLYVYCPLATNRKGD